MHTFDRSARDRPVMHFGRITDRRSGPFGAANGSGSAYPSANMQPKRITGEACAPRCG